MIGNPHGGELAPAQDQAFSDRLAALLERERKRTGADLDELAATALDDSDDTPAKLEYGRRAARLLGISETLELIQEDMFGSTPSPQQNKK